jgi:hypothetical protein
MWCLALDHKRYMRDTVETMRHKNILIAGVIAVVLGGAVATTAAIKTHQTNPSKPAVTATQAASHHLIYQGENGKTALDLLKTQAHVTIKNTSFGPLVDSINGVQGGGKYWMFYVNGRQASVGAGAYITKTGERIEWKFE